MKESFTILLRIIFISGEIPYYDMWVDIEKFSYFSKSVRNAVLFLEFEPDIIHCHDWQSSLVPVFLKAFYCADSILS